MKGFSLIEMLVYLGLLTMLISGALQGACAIASFSTMYRAETIMERDGRFMLQRTRYHLQEHGTDHLMEELLSLTRYQVTDIKVTELGDGSVESPTHTLVSFTLNAAEHAPSLRRSFHTAFYSHAP